MLELALLSFRLSKNWNLCPPVLKVGAINWLCMENMHHQSPSSPTYSPAASSVKRVIRQISSTIIIIGSPLTLFGTLASVHSLGTCLFTHALATLYLESVFRAQASHFIKIIQIYFLCQPIAACECVCVLTDAWWAAAEWRTAESWGECTETVECSFSEWVPARRREKDGLADITLLLLGQLDMPAIG